MDMEAYARVILAEVGKKAEGTFRPEITKQLQLNGERDTALAARMPDGGLGPVVSLKWYHGLYEKGVMDAGAAAGDICRRILEEAGEQEDPRLGAFRKNWELMEPCIYAGLINRDRNRELLEGSPWRSFLDLAVVYYGQVECASGDGLWIVPIKDEDLEIWGKTEEDLYRSAAGAGDMVFAGLRPGYGYTMPEALAPLAEAVPGEEKYILTNEECFFGSGGLLDGRGLGKISRELGGDFIVLPGSIDGSLIIPKEKAGDLGELAAVMKRTSGDKEYADSWLPDHVYWYDWEEGVLKTAA